MSEATIEKMQTEVKKRFEPTIIKIECENGDKVLYSEEGNLGNFITIPNGYEGKIKIFLSDKSETLIDISVLRNILDNDVSKSQSEKYPHIEKIKEILADDIDNLKDAELKYGFFNLVTYKDITDYEFNNFDNIEQTSLMSDGLWIGNGIRKISLEFNEELEKFISSARKKDIDEYRKIEAFAFLNKKNNDMLEIPLEFKIKRYGKDFILLLDTDIFLNDFNESSTHTFYGKIKIQIRQDSMGIRDEKVIYSFSFPFEIKMKNPVLSDTHIATEKIAIDFGTSSTCIARDRGKKLISFSDSPKGLLDYENMTALIIYNWKAIYSAWKNDTRMPYLNRNLEHAGDVNLKHEHFDYGDKIKWELENAPDAKTMDAIITKLKSLPEILENKNNQKEEISPFDDFKQKVYLTDKVTEENDETLNPIALYAYFIGRALNLQIQDKIYTKYTLTMPVNFNQYKKDRIKESIEYGLRKSLPIGLKNELEVKNEYEESVALLGSAKKLKHLKFTEGKEASLFAVFDFGGGTLDFAFGLYRKVSDKEDISVFEDELNKYKNIIEIFKTDGELVGGETLIESLSWQIYKDNADIMEENNISIYIPKGEKKIENYPQRLFGDRHIDHVNLKSINERLSREFFISQKFELDKIELFPIDNKDTGINLELKNLNINTADDFLDEKISAMVKNFRNVIEETFSNNIERLKQFGFDTFDINEVKILQAGNTCKAKWVKEAFSKHFKDVENIIFINDEKKEITPKNAVAKGALMLDGIGVYNYSKIKGSDLMPLDRYIWEISDLEEMGEDAKAILKKGATAQSDWKSISKINGNSFNIYYSIIAQLEDEDDDKLLYYTIMIPEELLEDGKYDIWAKPYDGKYLECILGNIKGDNLDTTKKMIIDLDSGEITK